MEDGFDLIWKNYFREFSRHTGNLRGMECLSDVTLFCHDGQRQFPVHKIILAACSSFFEKVFTSTAAATTKVLIMSETDPEMLEFVFSMRYCTVFEKVSLNKFNFKSCSSKFKIESGQRN